MSAESESGLNVFGKVKLTFSDIYDRQDAIMKKINLKAQTANLNDFSNYGSQNENIMQTGVS